MIPWNVNGVLVDASALMALPSSLYARTLLRTMRRESRPVVIPASSLAVALASGHVQRADLEHPGYTIIDLSSSWAWAIGLLMHRAKGDLTLDHAHIAHEAWLTKFRVLTANGDAYAGLPFEVHLDEIP